MVPGQWHESRGQLVSEDKRSNSSHLCRVMSMLQDIMVYAFTAGIVFQFDKDGFSQGHNLTNYARWISATQDYEVAYVTQ
jgi:hypothetical protein